MYTWGHIENIFKNDFFFSFGQIMGKKNDENKLLLYETKDDVA
jgi:hypothetical protein